MKDFNKEPGNEQEVSEKKLRRNTIKALIGFGIGAVATLSGLKWLVSRHEEDELPWTLRKVLEANGRLANWYSSHFNLAPEYPVSKAVRTPRKNGMIGLESPLDINQWKLNIHNNTVIPGLGVKTITLSLDDLKRLPKTELTFEFKCIEGWSEITNWGGVRLSDLIRYYQLAGTNHKEDGMLTNYAGFETPDKEYYTGMEIESVMHPQTLLCYEMNGKPLELSHGAPLRLMVPVKYGIKSLKRVGTITFTNSKPKDYWAERGYDYHSGL